MIEFAIRRSLFGRRLAIAGAMATIATWLCWKLGKAPIETRHRPGSQ